MAVTYELWDFETRNLVAVYESEGDALAALRADLREHGRTVVERLILLTADEDGVNGQVAAGEELVARATAYASQPG